MAFPIPDELDAVWAVTHQSQKQFAAYLLNRPLHLVLVKDDPKFTLAATGYNILVGSIYIAGLSYVDACTALCHEIVHDMYGHPKMMAQWHNAGTVKGRPFVNQIAQFALDYIVNDTLWKCGMSIPHTWLHDQKIAKWTDDEAETYAKLYDMYEKNNMVPSPGGGIGCGGEDITPADGIDTDTDGIARRNMVVRKALAEIDPKKMRGVMAGDLERLVERLSPTNVDWRDVVRPRVASVTGREQSTWSRLNRSSYVTGTPLPGKRGTRAGDIVVIADTSGSIGRKEQEKFMSACIEMFTSCKPKSVRLLEIDVVLHRERLIHNLEEMKDIMRPEKNGLIGGGGTDMRKAWQWMRENKVTPDLVIVLTDMYTPFPSSEAPAREVIWISTTRAMVAPAEAGRTVFMLNDDN